MDIYNVNNYSDEQLYEILDMSHPTDRELEAKIIQMLQKYENIKNEMGNQLYSFFDSIYKRFFNTDSDDEQEGMTNPDQKPMNPKNDDEPKTSPSPESKETGYKAQSIASVQQFDYSPDKLQLNPLLKQTIKRVISIDSQYRNITTSPMTTSFSFDLSEPIRDVVSLKLYSVQIPYTWYTISKSYGSNFFYLRGNKAGILDKNYKIAINPGNYNQTTLPATINAAFQDLSNNYASDINFNGVKLVNYDPPSAKTTIKLNIQNTFNETYYNLYFPFMTYPTDLSNNKYSIPGYLGFNNQTYPINAIQSNQTYRLTTTINTQLSQDFVIDDSNNYFTVVQYIGYDSKSGYDSRSQILNTFRIELTQNGLPYNGNATRQDILNAVNTAISTSGYFETNSKIEQVDITDPKNQNYKYTYFKLTLTLDRYKVKYVPNAKIAVLFPNESPRLNPYQESFTIWQLQTGLYTSCFYFDNSMNEYSHILSETPPIQSTFSIDNSTRMIMTCTTPQYITYLNDFSMNIQQGTYNISQFLNAITTSFSQKNTPTNQYFNMANTSAFLDASNYFNLSIDLNKTFTNKNYSGQIDGNSFLTKPNNFTTDYSISPSTATNLYDISYVNISVTKLFGGYSLDTSCIMIIQPDTTTWENGGNGQIDPIYVCTSTTFYPTYQSFLTGIQNAFLTTSVTTSVNTQTPFSRTTLTSVVNESTIDISLNLNAYYYLSEGNYDISFVDANYDITNSLNAWYRFNIYSNYSITTDIATGYATIKGYDSLSQSVTDTISIYDNCNNTIVFSTNNSNSPNDTITIIVPQNTYTIGSLITAINTEFSKNPKTYGSYIKTQNINNQEYTYLWINTNNIYTTQDYILDFYDPINFVSCYSGASSVQNTTWDSTIGWILGFRDYTQYYLIPGNQTKNQSNTGNPYYYLNSISSTYIINSIVDPNSQQQTNFIIALTGDTTLNTNLYNYFLISLDDFIQNHLNDGLVTITRNQTSIQIPDYAYSTTQVCDPATGQLVSKTTPQSNSDNVTNSQLYALNQSIISQQNSNKEYSPGPFIKDLFGFVPIKPPANPGDYYTEFGGTLQNQERVYFGPVNIRKMSIQLLTDRGTIVDLNGSNWSFSFVCEQLYRASSS
jgi:hypothetical protein